ncbi:MAG: hypothetical protein H0X30_03700 [Anaerolineae bacterium]|nr:hypothetical protein [Anaerolineae bacterium]
MKTGQVAIVFRRDGKTIRDWTNRYREFFSKTALAEDEHQRDYVLSDLYVLNTIRSERVANSDWELIRVKLQDDYRDENLPPAAKNIEGEQAVTVYVQMREMQTKIETLEQRLEDQIKESEIRISALQAQVEREREIGERNRKEVELRLENEIRGRAEAEVELRILKRQIEKGSDK